jgi:hypothetical protein
MHQDGIARHDACEMKYVDSINQSIFADGTASYTEDDIRLMSDILLREQSEQPDKIRVREWVFVHMKQLVDCLHDALRIWHTNRTDMILACSMLSTLQCNFPMYDYKMLPRWHVSQCNFSNGPANHHLSLVRRLCAAGLARKPASMLRLIRDLQEAITFLRNKLLPVVRRYEPWHGILSSCAMSLEEAVLTCSHAT